MFFSYFSFINVLSSHLIFHFFLSVFHCCFQISHTFCSLNSSLCFPILQLLSFPVYFFFSLPLQYFSYRQFCYLYPMVCFQDTDHLLILTLNFSLQNQWLVSTATLTRSYSSDLHHSALQVTEKSLLSSINSLVCFIVAFLGYSGRLPWEI